jgi:hypothetical protein
MDDLTEFLLTGYIALPTIVGVGTESMEVWAVINLIMFCVLFVVAVNNNKED